MDFNILLSLCMSVAFILVPSFLFARLTNVTSTIGFLSFCLMFSAIGVVFGIIPEWFIGIVILGLALLLYETVFNRGVKTNE